MRYLFVFAHPDDETVACASTIRQLVDRGDEVFVIHTTDGGAGEVVTPEAQERFKKLGSVKAVRQEEMAQVQEHLGLTGYEVYDFQDGLLTNQLIWGALKEAIIESIDTIQPEVVITFEHAGWYYHLDHVGTSISTTLAFQQSAHRPLALLFSYYRPTGTQEKWKYVFSEDLPISHEVRVGDVQHKITALEKHASQELGKPKAYAQTPEGQIEYYQLALSSKKGKQLFENHPVFKRVA